MPPSVDVTSIAGPSLVVTPPIQSTLLTNQIGQQLGNATSQLGTTVAGLQMRLFADFQKYLDPDETPFTSSLKTGKAVNQKKVEWGQGFLMPNTATTNASGIAGTGAGGPPATTVITLADASNYNRIQLNQVMINTTTGEHLLVTAKGASNQVTVIRSYAGTTPTADANARTLELLAPSMYENQDTPFVGVAKGATDYNFFKLIDRGIWVSEIENNTPDYEYKGNKYDAYLDKTMKEVAILFEKTMIRGRRAASDPPEGATTSAYYPSDMGGLDQFTPLYYDMLGGPLTEFALTNMIYETWDRVGDGNMPKRLLVGGFMRLAIDSLWNGQREARMADTEVNTVWKKLKTSFGDVEYALSRYIPAGSIYFINTDDISIHPYQNMAWKEVRLPSNGAYIRGRFTGAYTSMWPKTAARVKILNAATSAALYGNM